MIASTGGRWIGAALLVFAIANTAAAQAAAEYPSASTGRVSFGIETSLVAGPRDSIAFFNYTDYKHNALRVARLRLMGEWRALPRLSFIAEARTEDGDGVTMAALYGRWRPFARRDFSVQVGRVPPVIGSFPRRAYGHDNLVIGFPLAYQYLTSLRPDALPATVDDLLRMRGRGWEPSFPIGSTAPRPGLPMASGFRWDTGVEVAWRRTPAHIAFALTRGAPARPLALNERSVGVGWSTRGAIHSNSGIVIGLSGASGTWIDRSVIALATPDRNTSSRQTLVGVDAEYGSGRWLFRGEALRSSFNVPMASVARGSMSFDMWSGYAEGRYRIAPRWQVAGRVDRLRFGNVTGEASARSSSWDAGVDRVEGTVSFRIARQAHLRASWQHNWRDGGRIRARGFPAVELLYWF